MASIEPTAPSPSALTKSGGGRIAPRDRAKTAALQSVAALQVRDVPDAKRVSYYSPDLIQCTLPHSDPKTPAWARKNGNFSLVISSGYDGNAQPYGIPYGSFPRLVLAHIITRVVSPDEQVIGRRIQLASHFGTFLKQVGYTGDMRGKNPSARRMRDQMLRLLNATVAFRYDDNTEHAEHNKARQIHVSPDFDLWWDFKNPDQGSLFGSWIEISENFYNAILASPVPLRTDVLKELRKSPLAIDVYMWVSYRLFSMETNRQRELLVTFGKLQEQFGTGIAKENYRLFRSQLKQAFKKVAALWHHGDPADPNATSLLEYEFIETGLFLYRSPLLIGRGKRLTTQEEAAAIMERREFDTETISKARLRAGVYDVYKLQEEYFLWLEKRNFTPKDPRANFLSFILQHRKRNG